MSIFLVARRGAAFLGTEGECISGRGFLSSKSGRGTSWRRTSSALMAAALACFALACSDDEADPAEQTGSAGGVNTPDASVRDLPGDGLEGTPDFDRNTSQREPIGPEALGEAIDAIDRGIIGGEPVEDAGAPTPPPTDASDAGAD